MTDELLNALDDCLSAMLAGESLETSLARHPALAADLRPLLETGLAAQRLNADLGAPRAAQNASRAQFLARAAERRSSAPRPAGWAGLLKPRALVNALAVLLVTVFGAYGIAAASAQSLPGEALYGVKRAVEQTQLTFTVDLQARAHLQEQLAARRIEEARAVLAAGRVADLELSGVIDEITDTQWVVAGLTLNVPAEASITGVPFPGLFVEVAGESQSNGTVRASVIRVTGLTFRGRVNAIGADQWRIDEQSVWLNAQTQVEAEIGLGDEVAVSARTLAGGQVLALRITRVEPLASPTATVTVTHVPTATPSQAPHTPVPVTATPTASPTLIQTRAPTSSPTHTRQPTNAPTADSEDIEFVGIVESIGDTVWLIDGQTVLITANTEIRGDPQVGDMVEVRAVRDAAGGLTATRISREARQPEPTTIPPPTDRPPASPTPEGPPPPTHTPEPTNTQDPQEVEFEGVVTDINGNVWTISAHLVIVTGDTILEGNPGVGNHVGVNAWQYPDGTLVARRIRVR